MKQFNIKKYLPHLFLILIFLLFCYFRFYNVDKRIGFDWDQEQFSTQVRDIVVHHKFTLLGPRVVSDKGFFLAPYFSYLIIPFFLISHMHPSALLFLVVFVDLLFFLVAYKVIGKLFNPLYALFFLFLWAFNNQMVGYDSIPWWPIVLPIGIMLNWLCLYLILKYNRLTHWILLGVVLALFMNMHFQFIFLIVFSGIFLLHAFKSKLKFNFLNIIATFVTFGLFFLPLVLFDFRHQFLNTHLFLNFFTTSVDNQPKSPTNWILAFQNYIDPFVYFRSIPLVAFFYMVILGMGVYLWRIKKDFYKTFYFAATLLWLIFPLFFAFYGKRPSEYYFIFLYPYIMIIIIDFFYSVRKELLYIYCFFIILMNINAIAKQFKTNPFGLYYKDKVAHEIQHIVQKKKIPVNVTLNVPLGFNNGYRYFLEYYGVYNTGNSADPLIEIRIPPQQNDVRINEIGIKVPKEIL